MLELTDRGKAFRRAIAGYIDARCEAKLKGNEDGANTAARYEYTTWLADAARRVGQIQAVTHVLKATHPDARGTSLHVAPTSLPQHDEIGSHLLAPDFDDDVVGNAAALDVFKLLKIEVDGKRLLDWMHANDVDLQAALSADADVARGWMQAFASLVREDRKSTSHPMAKQVYWLIGDEPQDDAQYELLQPMFASSLAHMVHASIQDARFGDTNKQAHQAFRKKQPADGAYRDYRNLVARRLGGTKPQNISQLNSERGGVNYLLASVPPPEWKPREGAILLKLDSVFAETRGAFFWFGNVRHVVHTLATFLKANPDPTIETRNRREAIARSIGDEMASFGVSVRGRYAAGWTRDAACRLQRCEQLWLDPGRRDLEPRDDPDHPEYHDQDIAFQQAYDQGTWPDEVATRFGLWLNGQLRGQAKELITLSAPEMRHFARQAVLDVAWPLPLQRRATEEVA